MKPIFIGSGVALVTPFSEDGEIDFGLFSKLIEFQIANETDAIIVCGTTGEGSTLTKDERIKLFSVAVRQVAGRVPVIAGTGSNSTSFSLELMREAERIGIDAHLSVTPYYNKTSQKGIIEHYFTLADKAVKPIIVYNVPTRTCVNIQPETYKKLGLHDNIIAVKEADPDIAKLQKSIYLCNGSLDFYVGNDNLITPACLSGCKGVISVLANILPNYTHNMSVSAVYGNVEVSNRLQTEILELANGLFTDVSPIPVKYMLELITGIKAHYRLPLCKTDEKNQKYLNQLFSEYVDYFKSEKVKM